jgi:ribonuclease HII
VLDKRDIEILKKIKSLKYVAMADEAGAGCMAGNLVVASVILNPLEPIIGLKDSKKLSEKKRNILFDEIVKKALDYKIVNISPEIIDKINILQARMLGFRLSIDGLIKVEHALIDGNRIPIDINTPSDYIIKGDDKIDGIAAASILAKVTRDRQMIEASKKYPQYGFDKHKGYVTKSHKESLNIFGICDLHRKSYKPVKEVIGRY